jgi:DNA-binding LacI/PurR family transcriptional regulator
LLDRLATWPFVASAQQRDHRIGVIIGYAEKDPETRSRLEAFRKGLAKTRMVGRS